MDTHVPDSIPGSVFRDVSRKEGVRGAVGSSVLCPVRRMSLRKDNQLGQGVLVTTEGSCRELPSQLRVMRPDGEARPVPKTALSTRLCCSPRLTH